MMLTVQIPNPIESPKISLKNTFQRKIPFGKSHWKSHLVKSHPTVPTFPEKNSTCPGAAAPVSRFVRSCTWNSSPKILTYTMWCKTFPTRGPKVKMGDRKGEPGNLPKSSLSEIQPKVKISRIIHFWFMSIFFSHPKLVWFWVWNILEMFLTYFSLFSELFLDPYLLTWMYPAMWYHDHVFLLCWQSYLQQCFRMWKQWRFSPKSDFADIFNSEHFQRKNRTN